MYSVEDLLISHGYKLSRNLPASHDDSYEGHQPEVTRTRAGRGILNGYENDPATSVASKKSLVRGCLSDSESCRGTPGSHTEPHGSSFRTSEVGFYGQPPVVQRSQPQTKNSQAYWRRRGQESSGLPGPRDREDLEVRGLVHGHSRPLRLREGPWDVGVGTENVMKKAAFEEELRMSGAAKWQNVGSESWNQQRKLGRQMSDGGGGKLFQDLYPFIPGEHVLNPRNKGKSQSLPRVLSPESLSCVEMPVSLNDGHLPGVPKMPLYPPNCAPNLETTRHTEKGVFIVPLPQPKFGRPLKPPSYELHQQSRGGVENSDNQGNQLTDDRCVPYLTKTNDARQEHCGLDTNLEPPVYVPPPSYHSPSPHITNPYLEDARSKNVCGGRSQQQPPTEKTSTACQRSAGFLGTGNEYGASPRSPRGLPEHPCPTTHDSSVQYIPFDDPRIRHIKLTHPQGFSEETQLYDKLYSSLPPAPQEPAPGTVQPGGTFFGVQSVTSMAGNEWVPAVSDPGPQWLLGQLPRDGAPNDVADQRHNCAVRGERPDVRGTQHRPSRGHTSSPHPQGENTCETITKLKKFETGPQTKKSSKKKKNETVFCLVSIPVKSESHLPEIDMNNNDLKQSTDKKNGLDMSPVLQEQSLLSMSSTDLELQALTGSMASRTELQKQGLGEAEEDKQTNDLRFIHPARHTELKYAGPWPGHQFRDQQTQTSFTDESQSSQCLPSVKLGGAGNAVLTPKYFPHSAPGVPTHTALAPSNQRQRPNGQCLKGQAYLSPSSNSAFSRTSSTISEASAPKAGQDRPQVDVHGRGTSPTLKDEVVKGEPTSPCNSQQLFGQFLLKPVSRRPWDLISQLENFNKELQEQKESSHSSSEGSGEDSESEGQQGDCPDARQEISAFGGYSQAEREAQQPRTLVPRELVLKPGRGRSRSERCSEEQTVSPLSQGVLQAEDSRGELFGSADGNWITGKRIPETGTRRREPAVSPGPMKRVMAFRSNNGKPAPLSHTAELREPPESQKLTGDTSSVKLSTGVTAEAGSGDERETAFPLSLGNKNRGLSAPDLRSMGLHMGQEQNASKLDGSFEKANAIEIPQNESLQERAERILGIEVAVESLLRGSRRAGHNQHPVSDESAFRPDSPREEPLTSSAQPDGPAASKDAFYGRRKCGWTESPLFVGVRDMTRQTPHSSAHSGLDGAITCDASSSEPQLSSLEPKSLEQKDSEMKPPFRSTLFHFIEGSPSVAASEKKGRNTSKVIESLQEKLASPLRRADPDRLLRMREVSSVSRMRLLSSRSTDSIEEAEEMTVEGGQGEKPGGFVSLNGGDLPRRTASIPKDVILLEDSRHLAAQSARKKGDHDFWCPDSYDPSRVERV